VHDCAVGLACDLSHTCGPPEQDSTGASGCTAAKAVGNGADEWAVLGLALITAIMGARGRRHARS
jgi:hypothetical protein